MGFTDGHFGGVLSTGVRLIRFDSDIRDAGGYNVILHGVSAAMGLESQKGGACSIVSF